MLLVVFGMPALCLLAFVVCSFGASARVGRARPTASPRAASARSAHPIVAVEVKSFIGASAVKDLRDAIGQYVLYRSVLRRLDPGRAPYLVIDAETALTLFSEPLAEYLVIDEQVLLIIVDITTERIVEWRS